MTGERILNKLSILIFSVMLTLVTAVPAFALSPVYSDDANGYSVYIEDEASLLSEEEISEIKETMIPVTEYGNAGFYTTDYTSSSTEVLAKNIYREWFGSQSGVLFIIDMDNRNIWLWANGSANRVINKEAADIITDNTYMYARRSEFGECAKQTFIQVSQKLQGEKLNNPLKIGTTALLSVLLSFAVVFIILMRVNKKKQNPDVLLPLAGAVSSFAMANAIKQHVKTTKQYTPRSSGGGGGFSGGGGGFGGGGGGFGGGGSGGGHGF